MRHLWLLCICLIDGGQRNSEAAVYPVHLNEKKRYVNKADARQIK